MRFVSITKLKKQLNDLLASKTYDINAYLEDIEKDIFENGKREFCEYELSSSECKDKLPHLIEMYVEIYALDDDTYKYVVEFL